jgi:hypothetical protein
LVASAIHNGELTATVAPWLTISFGRPLLAAGFSTVAGATGALVGGVTLEVPLHAWSTPAAVSTPSETVPARRNARREVAPWLATRA